MVDKGNIIISEPYLGDENFERSVVLICENNEDGTVGFIYNQPTELTLDAVLTGVDDCKELLYIGGPVQQDSLHFLYKNNQPLLENSMEITEDLYWGGDFEQLLVLINNHSVNLSDFRFFLGYSGWAPGQLEEEMKQNSWIVGKPELNELFETNPADLWRTILRRMGGKYKMYSNYPIDPKLN